MLKLNSNKKFYLILGTVIFFGVCLLGLGIVAVQSNQANQNTSTTPDTSMQDQYQTRMEQSTQEANQKAYQQCIDTANKLFNDYVAKIPKNLTIEEYGVARQSFEDLRENHKEDCDREYSQ